MEQQLTVLITGTSKGIGKDLVRIFLEQNPHAIIYATSRESQSDALKRWQNLDASKRVKCRYLDVSSSESISQFASQMLKEEIKIDVLINNAGVCKMECIQSMPTVEWATQCLKVNTVGPILLTEALLPILSKDAKVVHVSSAWAGLINQPPSAQTRFSDPNLTKEHILEAVQQYIDQVANKSLVNFSQNVYAVSKMLLGAWSKFVLQKKWLKAGQISICVSPGLCLTEMTKTIDAKLKEIAHSSQSGARKIHQTIFKEGLDPDVFYHRARSSDFFLTGQGLPRE